MVRVEVCLYVMFLCPMLVAGEQPDADDSLRLGRVMQSQGRLIEAEHVLQRAVSAATSPSAAVDALSNLASVESDLSRFDEAARIYNKALGILASDPGASRGRMRTLQIRSAEVYLEAGQIDVAERLLLPLVTGQMTDAYALDVLACIYAIRSRLADAEATERQSLAIMRDLPNADPASLAIGTLHLANFLNRSDRPLEALPYAREALRLFASLTLPNPPMQASAEINLASIYGRTGHPEDARQQSDAALRTVEGHYGPTDRRTGLMLLSQAAVLRGIGDSKPARAAQKRAELILNSSPQPGNTVPVNALFPK